MRQAYGIDQIVFNGGIVGDGSGQTIAIVDLYDDPNIFSDLDAFDKQFSTDGGAEKLYQQYGASSSFLTKYEPQGVPSPAPIDPKNGWGIEISLDVEWAHAIAPGAKILLTEAATDLYGAAVSAANRPGVSAVSMSWGSLEFSGESTLDCDFETPSGHNGVTFLAATGDHGAYYNNAPAALYPAYSPNVVAVGGTTLSLNQNGQYGSESGWTDGGGGVSSQEGQPYYQAGVVTQSSTQRTIPDISMDADPNSGGAIYDSYDSPSGPWGDFGGTSLATPMWAAVISVVNQDRAGQGFGTLYGPAETLPKLYQDSAADFHDVTTGNNGLPAGPGYDLVTGRGTPIAPSIVTDLADNAVAINRTGDASGDSIDVSGNGTTTQVTVNGSVVYSGLSAAIDVLNVTGSSDDSLTINYLGGNPVPFGKITYNGGTGTNSLFLSADANISQTTSGWTLSGNVSSAITTSNVAQTTLAGGPSANQFTTISGTVTINLGAGDQAVLNDGSIGPGYANTIASYADRTDFTGTGFAYHVIGVGSVTANGTSTDLATVYDHTYNGNQSGSNVLDASTNPNTAIMRYWNGGTLSVVGFGSATAVQQYGPDMATQAAFNASFVHLQGTWYSSIVPTTLISTVAGNQVAQTGNLTEQDLFVVGSDGLVREDKYYYSNHTNSGLSVIDSNTTFATGTKLTAYSDGSTINVFGVGQDGKVKWAQHTARGWTGFVSLDQFIPGANYTFAAGTPLIGTAHSGAFNLFAVGTDGYIKQYTYSGSPGGWQVSNLSFAPSVPSGTPLAVWDSGSGIDVYAVLANGTLETFHDYGTYWGWSNVAIGGGLPAATPLAVSELGSNVYLFGVTSTGVVDEIYYDGSLWHWGNIISPGPDTFGSNAALGIRQYAPGEFQLFGVNTSGAIKNDYYVNGGSWGSQTLGGSPPFSLAASVAFYADSSGVLQVFGPTRSGDLAVEEYNNSQNVWSEYALGRSLSPQALQNSIVSSQVAQVGNLNEQDLFVVGSDGLAREDQYIYSSHTDSGLSVIDFNTTFAAGTKLTAYSDGSTINVFGVGQDGKVKWAQHTARAWTGFVSLDQFIPGANYTFAGGTPLIGTAHSGVLNLFAVGTDGYIKQYTYSGSPGGWQVSNLSFAPSVPSGTPLAVWDSGSGIDVYAVLANGTLETFHDYGTYWGWSNVAIGGGLPAATPLAVSELGSNVYLFGVTSTGVVDEIYYDGSLWHWGNIISPGPDTFESNAALGIRQYAPGEFQLFGVNTSGAIKNDYYVNGGSWGSQTLGGSPPFSLAASVAFYADSSGVLQVFGPTKSGDLAVEEYNNSQNVWSEYALGRSLSPTVLQNSIVSSQVAQVGNLNEQDLFVVGSDGLVREDKYYYSNHTDSGLSVIDANTTFVVGTKLTAYSDGSTTNVFGVGQDGKVKWAQYTAARGWTGFVSLDQFIPGANYTFAAGTPLMGAAHPGVFNLFAVGTDGYIKQYTYSGSPGAWQVSNLNTAPSVPSGTPLAVWDSGSGIDVYAVLANGTLETFHDYGTYWGWSNVPTGGLAAATPLAVSELGSNVYLFGVTSTGVVDEIYYDGSLWHWGNIISAGPDTFGSNAALGIRQYAPGEFQLFGVNTSGAIKNDYYVNGGSWGSQTLGGSPPFSAAAGVVFYADPSGVLQVFGATTTGTLAVEEYNGSSWSEYGLS